MIHVIATIQIVPGQREAFLAEFRQVVPLVRAEAGCLEYGPAVDIATDISAQSVTREDVVTIVEKWDSPESLKAHLAAPHMADYRSRVKHLVAGVELRILKPA